MKKTKHNILTNDPSITGWGYAVISSADEVLSAGCIKTESEQKKRRIRKGDDTARRVSEINRRLLRVIEHYGVELILTELPHGSQNANAAVMIGMVAGVMQTFSDTLSIPIEWYSEGDAKKCLLNRRSVTKEETINAISELYSVPWKKVKYKDEAIADALAIYNVAKTQSTVIQWMQKQ